MKKIRWIYKLFTVGLVFIFSTGCGLGTAKSLPPTATPKAASTGISTPNLDQMARSIVKNGLSGVQDVGVSNINFAEQEMKSSMREAGGARTLLGDQADAVFQKLDAAEAAAVAALMAQIKTSSANGDAPDAGRSQITSPIQSISFSNRPPGSRSAQFKTIGVLGLLVTAPMLFANAERDANGASKLPLIESDETVQDNVAVHISMRPSLHGSQMDAEVQMSLRIPGPPPYEESSTGNLSIDLCPDAQGNVPLTLKMKTGFTVNGGGSQLEANIQATGHVNDEGRLASMDYQSQIGSGAQSDKSGQYVEMKISYTLSGMNQVESEISNMIVDQTRTSSQVTPEFAKTALVTFMRMIGIFPTVVMRLAEDLWTKGYCVEIQVTDLADNAKTVEPASQTQFTANVRHKFEDAALTVPVIAKLAGGKVSVTPAGSKVTAPAAFTYLASDQRGAKATVHLETTSKRGIGALDLTFTTQSSSYELEFDSTFVSDTFTAFGTSGPIKSTQHVHVIVPLQWSEVDQAYLGEAPLEYVLFDVPPIIGYGGDGGYFLPCPNKVSATGGTFRVLNLKILNATNTQSTTPNTPSLELTIDPGETVESVIPVCPPPGQVPPGFSFPLTTWSQKFASAHTGEVAAMSGPYTIKDWTERSGNVAIVKTYTSTRSTMGMLTVHENTTITLVQKVTGAP